ncbi:2Fe-2S iron-sulfur cluster-binding protein [Bowmanella yangjiangensis]|uniref:2Fe-2S iron-sulfur cluster binding domain-containing protein n=1 Tax=Bowmanella yangjiangensis TaxID=2811230 RepID=A0ABS3CRI8_9ALTE|nr:2Fe-2S iron-sulfur cluster-binding protein [Bowmanella yangjiangensis]MBN7819665.1 2Fe-2S iron-sulfur cluster binding domain-containing protein [Bowmanella yangjiangensis]
MLRLALILPSGDVREVQAEPGFSLLVAVQDAGIDALPGVCNGCCSCGTCLVRIDQVSEQDLSPCYPGEQQILAKLSAGEKTRLACQVMVNSTLAGGQITLLGKSRPGKHAGD